MMGVDKNSRAGLGPKFGSWTMGFEWPTNQSEAQKYHFGQKIGQYKKPGSLNRHPGPKYTNPNPTQARKSGLNQS